MNWKKIAVAAVLCGAAGAAGAVGNIVDVTVYDRVENRALPVYQHGGRYYVVGRPGNEYQVQMRSRAGADVLTVLSVDGVNAISGETANWSQSGYVLVPGQGYDIRGWRKSLERIAAFYFTEHQNSYAARTGRPQNVGVIGVAVFRRKAEPEARIDQSPPREAPYSGARDDSPYPAAPESTYGSASGAARSSESAADSMAGLPPSTRGQGNSDSPSASSAPSRSTLRESESGAPRFRHAPSAQRSPSLGTGHGRSESSRVTYTSFERATAGPEEVVAIHYDTYANLVALGVIRAPRLATPTPFPGQFVPDPR